MSAIDPQEPTAAEMVSSVLAAARSLTLTTDAHRVELVGLHSLEAPGRLLLNVPVETHLGAEVAAAPYGDVTATLELADVAPVSVPDRVRARVLLGGWLALAGSGGASWAPAAVRVCASQRACRAFRTIGSPAPGTPATKHNTPNTTATVTP